MKTINSLVMAFLTVFTWFVCPIMFFGSVFFQIDPMWLANLAPLWWAGIEANAFYDYFLAQKEVLNHE